MNMDYRAASLKYWEDTHREQDYHKDQIRVDDWLDRFVDIIVKTDRPLLDLGSEEEMIHYI